MTPATTFPCLHFQKSELLVCELDFTVGIKYQGRLTHGLGIGLARLLTKTVIHGDMLATAFPVKD